jgi:hypothetical protein
VVMKGNMRSVKRTCQQAVCRVLGGVAGAIMRCGCAKSCEAALGALPSIEFVQVGDPPYNTLVGTANPYCDFQHRSELPD